MKILILGASGFLGSYLSNYLQSVGHQISIASRECWEDFSLSSRNNSKLEELFSLNEVVINCIAETDIGKCDHLIGIEANEVIPRKISTLISLYSIYCVHISTDAFYNSTLNNSSENSRITLNNYYAKQKFNAELALEGTNSIILRTSFVGKNPRNIGMIDYLISSLRQEKKIFGWNDVFTSSVHITDLARLIDMLIHHKKKGIFNFGTDQSYSKFQLLEAIIKNFNHSLEVLPINSPLNHATRNLNCGMSSKKLISNFNFNLPTFNDVVQKCTLDLKSSL